MSRAVGLRHCLDEIDNTIRPFPVWMHHYDPLLHQPLLMKQHSSSRAFWTDKKKYNYEGLARKCVLFTTRRQACTSSDMCGLPAYLTVILHQAAHWSRDGLNIWILPYCTLLLHNFILCCNRLCTQCSQVDWHSLYLRYRSDTIIWNRRWNTLSLLNIWLCGLVGGTCFRTGSSITDTHVRCVVVSGCRVHWVVHSRQLPMSV